MMSPFNARILNATIFVLELGALWALLQIQFSGTSISLFTIIGTLAVSFMLGAHTLALTIQLTVPRFSLARQNLVLFLSTIVGCILALMLIFGMIILVSYLGGSA